MEKWIDPMILALALVAFVAYWLRTRASADTMVVKGFSQREHWRQEMDTWIEDRGGSSRGKVGERLVRTDLGYMRPTKSTEFPTGGWRE